MDAVLNGTPAAAADPRRTELLLDALKSATGTPGGHRLFRSGKPAGLFPSRAEPVGRVVPWAVEALEYLDRRRDAAAGECPLSELFHAVRVRFPDLTLPVFQHGLKRLHDIRAVRLAPAAEVAEPEYAVVVDGKLMYAAGR